MIVLASNVSKLSASLNEARNEIVALKARPEPPRPNIVQRYAPAISALIAILAFGLSFYYYLHALDATRASLANNLVYTMQKDERSLIDDFTNGKPGVGVGDVIAQMQSVYIQRTLGSIPDDVWPVFVKDFCGAMSHENFVRNWESLKIKRSDAFSLDFVSFLNSITDKDSKICKDSRRAINAR